MGDDLPYHERVSSNRTMGLFVALTILFLVLAYWRVTAAGVDVLAVVLFSFAGFFFFYSVNYRTLVIRLTSGSLELAFGVFRWTVRLDNVEQCQLDEIPLLKRMGGAGIHFMTVHGRYRASFNFLEYPRVVIMLKRPRGPVRDVSFSTRRPGELVRLIREAAAARTA